MTVSRRHFMTAAAGVCGAALCGCSQSPATGRSFFSGLGGGLSDDVAVGKQEHAKLVKAFGGVYEDAKLHRYLESIGARLAEVSEAPTLPYTFTIVNSHKINAFALPGGPVTITRGLLALCNSEAELAGVVGHEIGHITARHTAERQGQTLLAQLGLTVLSAALGSQELTSVASQGASALLSSYSRSQESEADALGARYMERAGYDVDKMVSFLDSLHDYSALEARMAGLPADQVDQFSMMASHPRTADRVRDAMRIAAVSKQQNAVVNREIYLNEINNLLFGDDPKEGIVRGQTFSHPGLRVTFSVPETFLISNGQTQVIASSPAGDKIIFDAARSQASSMQTHIAQEWAKGARLENLESLPINGMAAATATTVAQANGQRYDARLVAASDGEGRVFHLIFLTNRSRTLAMAEALKRTTYSLRRLSASEAAAIKPLRVVVTRVRPGETIHSMARDLPFGGWNDQWFAVLNQLNPTNRLTPGQVVKMVLNRA